MTRHMCQVGELLMLLKQKLLAVEQVSQQAPCMPQLQEPASLKICLEGSRPLEPALLLAPDTAQHHVLCSKASPESLVGCWGVGVACVTAPSPALLCGFPGDKLLEPLRYTHIAAATFVSVKRVVGCIQATMSLFSRCIGKGRNVALILKDIGMLLIESPRVQMKYYRDFLEMMTGKDTLKEVLLRVPGMLDLVIPRTATASSLTCSGHVIIFPEFELESVHGTLLRDYHNSPGKRLNEGRQKKAVLLRPPRQDEKERLLTGANTLCPGYTGEHSLEPGSLGGKPPPPEETPTGHQHPAGSTALSNSSRRKGPSLKHTSLAMKAFLQPGERRRE
ncbi:uncharacterized protein LOC121075128 isoform X1 [Cygnus olor]|uniref:uncharacterized protein LOC121075128 isoform X1 n=1 Tax=Cygnus olor TaxID=8869 RepID=UPI001ADEBA89|nr:uncharacterized protein LOC121075128 isoform X1 [Cygnus olor]